MLVALVVALCCRGAAAVVDLCGTTDFQIQGSAEDYRATSCTVTRPTIGPLADAAIVFHDANIVGPVTISGIVTNVTISFVASNVTSVQASQSTCFEFLAGTTVSSSNISITGGDFACRSDTLGAFGFLMSNGVDISASAITVTGATFHVQGTFAVVLLLSSGSAVRLSEIKFIDTTVDTAFGLQIFDSSHFASSELVIDGGSWHCATTGGTASVIFAYTQSVIDNSSIRVRGGAKFTLRAPTVATFFAIGESSTVSSSTIELSDAEVTVDSATAALLSVYAQSSFVSSEWVVSGGKSAVRASVGYAHGVIVQGASTVELVRMSVFGHSATIEASGGSNAQYIAVTDTSTFRTPVMIHTSTVNASGGVAGLMSVDEAATFNDTVVQLVGSSVFNGDGVTRCAVLSIRTLRSDDSQLVMNDSAVTCKSGYNAIAVQLPLDAAGAVSSVNLVVSNVTMRLAGQTAVAVDLGSGVHGDRIAMDNVTAVLSCSPSALSPCFAAVLVTNRPWLGTLSLTRSSAIRRLSGRTRCHPRRRACHRRSSAATAVRCQQLHRCPASPVVRRVAMGQSGGAAGSAGRRRLRSQLAARLAELEQRSAPGAFSTTAPVRNPEYRVCWCVRGAGLR
jgi:hypothetical protein